MIKKPNGSLRLVIDYRALNRLIKRHQYPMPRVDKYMEALKGNQYFGISDPEERKKTVSVTPDGKFQYKRLPISLAERPRYFQQLITTVTKGLQFQQCLCYFDDIPVMSVTFKDFLINLKLVIQRLVNVGLKAKTEKVLLGVCELKFLGFIVSGSRVKSDTNKIKLLQDLPKMSCGKCHKCNLIKHIQRKLVIPNIKPIPAKPMEVVELDIQGPYIKSENGNRYLVVITDHLTRFKFAKAISLQSAKIIIKVLKRILNENGFKQIVDRPFYHMNFNNKWKIGLLNIRQVHLIIHRPKV